MSKTQLAERSIPTGCDIVLDFKFCEDEKALLCEVGVDLNLQNLLGLQTMAKKLGLKKIAGKMRIRTLGFKEWGEGAGKTLTNAPVITELSTISGEQAQTVGKTNNYPQCYQLILICALFTS